VNTLERIVAQARDGVAERKRARPLNWPELIGTRSEVRSFSDALARPGLSLIAEHKRRSPSAGPIREDLSLADVVSAYERGGAAALSILTEGPNFGGHLDDLAAARRASSLPLLRKDFIVDEYQVLEAYAAGADAVLLIVAALTESALAALYEQVLSCGLTPLVEVHDGRELGVAVDLGARVIGINNRDLASLEVNTRRTFELLPQVPVDALKVAESGFSRPEELHELAEAGVDAALIGEALMRSPDVASAVRQLIGSS
jgi:indole-3-glycerol phosphate synthase